MIRNIKRAHGFILIPVAVAIALIGVLAYFSASQSAMNVNATGSELEASRADYVAQAGLQHALQQIGQQGCGPYTDLLNIPFGNDKYGTSLTTTLGTTTAYTISVDQDSWIRDDNPSATHPNDNQLHFRSDGVTERPVYRYDLSAIPSQAPIISAVAYFYVNKNHAEGPIDIHALTIDWTEDDASWDLLGDAMDIQVQATIAAQPNNGVWVSVNLTPLVQGWVNGQANFGITLNSLGAGAHGEYASRESGNAPYLEVVSGTPPSPEAKLKSVGTLDNGVSRTLLRGDVQLVQSPARYLELQPDAGEGIDASISQSNNSNNYGIADRLWVQDASSADDDHSLIKFNLGRLPKGARIQNATLELFKYSGTSGEVGVHRVLKRWDEGYADGAFGMVNWNNRTSSRGWNVNGGEFDARTIDTATISGGTGYYRWNVTELVQGWTSNTYANRGLILIPETLGTDVGFRSSDHGTAAERPKLTVTYTCACGMVCIAPQGAGKIALIGDDFSPDDDDEDKIELLESWGYEVDFYEDRNSWLINWGLYDLAYVSETSISGDVAADLEGYPIGVVNEEPGLYDNLSLGSGHTEHVGARIDVVDNSHFITSVFPQGELPIYSRNMEILSADKPLADGLQILGEFNGEASLTVTDKGASTLGGPATGRRVTLPLGQYFGAGFDWAHLNNNGLLLIHRAIEWGMGNEVTNTIGSVLLVVVDPNSLTAQEAARKSIIESWGYAVSLIDESDTQANFDAAAAANDVAYITEDVSAGNVNTKLLNAPIGVVSEEGNLADDFGIASGYAWGSGTDIAIKGSAHYIIDGFAGDFLTIFTTAEQLLQLTPSLAPDLQLLGSDAGYASLATVEAGAALLGGGTAAGRRVMVPWGGSGMDINHLNADGLTIFQRAIEWADGAELAGPIAHWRLDDASGATAIDSEGGHHGALNNGPMWTTGLLDGALEFDGDDDFVDLTSDAELDDVFLGGATVSVWLYLNGWGENAYGRVLDKASEISGQRDGWMIGTDGGNQTIAFAQGFTSERGFWRPQANTVNLNEWVHYAIVYNADSIANDPVIYLNGVAQTSLVEIAPSGTIRSDADISLRLGNYAQVESRTLDGKVDDVRIYDRELGAEEIAQLARKPGPIAHWKLDESSGTTAVDSVGGHDGTLANGPSWVAGQVDNALRFDGSNDRINVPHDNGLNLLSAMTVSAWINPDSVSGFRMVLTKGDNGVAENYWLGTDGDGVNFGFVDGGTYAQYTTSGLTLQTGQWQHIAATFDDAANEVKVYLDGTAETFSSTYTPAANAERLLIGSSYYGGEAFDGMIDDVRLYDRVLDASAIAELAAAGGGGGNPIDGGGPDTSCSGAFRDEFNAISWDGSDGTLSWAGPWAEVGESDGPGSGDVQIRDNLSDSRLRIRDNNNGGEGVARAADLSGATSATLSLEYRRQALDSSGDYVAVYASTNGIAGPWTELPGPRIQGGTNDNTYQPWSRDISAFISANTAIRLLSSPSLGNTDTVYFDNIQIDCSP